MAVNCSVKRVMVSLRGQVFEAKWAPWLPRLKEFLAG